MLTGFRRHALWMFVGLTRQHGPARKPSANTVKSKLFMNADNSASIKKAKLIRFTMLPEM